MNGWGWDGYPAKETVSAESQCNSFKPADQSFNRKYARLLNRHKYLTQLIAVDLPSTGKILNAGNTQYWR